MSFTIHVTGAAADAVERTLPTLIADKVASRITAQDPDLWGPDARAEATKRLGWTEAVAISRPLVPEIEELRASLNASGITHIVLAGMGGSSLAPEVMARTAQVELTVIDTTAPGQVRKALDDRLHASALVVSSKSGSTVETDSARRVYEEAFRAAGIDARERIIIVTDPGSPLDSSAREAGYRVFNADPNVGGRYSALTAFGLVPAGLAGVDISELLDEAEAVSLELAIDSDVNPGLILGAAISATSPRRDKLGLVADGTHLVGFGDWAEQLIAESTGSNGTGILPVVLDPLASEITNKLPDLQVARFVENAAAHHLFPADRHRGDILLSGTLAQMILVWEYAVVVAGRILGIDPFNQPDVESAKVATRGFLDNPPQPTTPAFETNDIQVRGTDGLLGDASDVREALAALISRLPSDGYLAIHAYVDRLAYDQLSGLRDIIAAQANRPVTFGWAPRFLHSTGQYQKGGPANGVFLQITQKTDVDLDIPGLPFTFGQLISAQAAGDARVLADHGRPVLTLTLSDPTTDIEALFEAAN